MDCLEGHRNTDGFGPDCRATLEAAMEARAMDFRLDSSLRQVTLWRHLGTSLAVHPGVAGSGWGVVGDADVPRIS
jgi:hypothetical protein